jgi:hypothetical protein
MRTFILENTDCDPANCAALRNHFGESRASAPAVGVARSPTPTMTSEVIEH